MYRKYLVALDTYRSDLGLEQKPANTNMSDNNSNNVQKEAVEKLWGDLAGAKDCKSLLKKHLSSEKYEKLKGLKTSIGGDLGDCIQSGRKKLSFFRAVLPWIFVYFCLRY